MTKKEKKEEKKRKKKKERKKNSTPLRARLNKTIYGDKNFTLLC